MLKKVSSNRTQESFFLIIVCVQRNIFIFALKTLICPLYAQWQIFLQRAKVYFKCRLLHPCSCLSRHDRQMDPHTLRQNNPFFPLSICFLLGQNSQKSNQYTRLISFCTYLIEDTPILKQIIVRFFYNTGIVNKNKYNFVKLNRKPFIEQFCV